MNTKRKRSPRFPYISMQEAEQYLRMFYKNHSNSLVTIDLAYKSMNLTPTSSSSNRILSSMIDYGVLESEGSLKNKRVRITNLGERVIKETREDHLEAKQREATLNDEMMNMMFQHWKSSLPSEDTIINVLEFEKGFTDRAAIRFAKVIQENYQYAKLDTYDYLYEEDDELSRDVEGQHTSQYNDSEREIHNSGQHSKPSRPISEDGLNDYRIPLTGGKRFAFLHVPSGLSHKDAEYIKKHVDLLMLQLVEEENEIPF